MAFLIHGIWDTYEIEPFTYSLGFPEIPDRGNILFNIACKNELFPLPTSPIIQMNSPCFISQLIFFRTGSIGFTFFFFFLLSSSRASKPMPPSKSSILLINESSVVLPEKSELKPFSSILELNSTGFLFFLGLKPPFFPFPPFWGPSKEIPLAFKSCIFISAKEVGGIPQL